MTTRICVVGDSHAGALKIGWNLLASKLPNLQVVFFAAGGEMLESLEVSSNCLTVADPGCAANIKITSGGLSAISNDYDIYILCGLGFQLFTALQFSKRYRIECSQDDGRIPISDECFQRSIEHRFRRTLSLATLQKLRMITAAPVIIVPAPLRNKEYVPKYVHSFPETEQARISELSMIAAQRVSEQNGFALVMQPPATLASPLTTIDIYGREQKTKDTHMNGLFGMEMLRAIFESVGLWVAPETVGATMGTAARTLKPARPTAALPAVHSGGT